VSAAASTLDLDDWLAPYQRIGSDVDAQIQRWGALSISLREMQGELAHSYVGVLGQRTLLQRLHQLPNLTPGADERPTPPILQLDAIWFTQLCASGQYRADGNGRRRPVKSRRKRCLLTPALCQRRCKCRLGRLARQRPPGGLGLALGRQ
jgi:hypothetical protein